MASTEHDRVTTTDKAVYFVLLLLFIVGSWYGLAQADYKGLVDAEGNVALELLPFGVGSTWATLGLLVAAGFTLALYSFLYKDNPLFKAAEHLYVGVGLGYSIVIAWFQYLKSELYFPLVKFWVRDNVQGAPDYWLIVPMILGLFLLARFVRQLQWLSRWAFAFIIGFGAGLSIPTVVQANILRQLEGSTKAIAFVNAAGETSIGTGLDGLCALVGVISVLIYFFFSVEHKGTVGAISKVGIWFIMISFGASYGYTVMGRMALFVGRVQFLLDDWLGLTLG